MNHADELNKLIALASRRTSSAESGYRSFEQESSAQLTQTLKAANLFFTCSVLGMEAVSHVIEDQAYNLGGEFRFYSAFQKFSRFRPQTERYRKLSSLGNPIYIFGVPDAVVPEEPNLYPVPLSKPASHTEINLANNWFVVLDSPNFVSMALIAQEVAGAQRPLNAPSKLIYRNFEGFWTYERETIAYVVDVLEDYKTQNKVASTFPF